jgi:hypothetical protein
MNRHSGLDPESSSSIKFLRRCLVVGGFGLAWFLCFAAASRRSLRFWIPGQARNDEAAGIRRASALASPGGIHENPECGASRRKKQPADCVRPTKTVGKPTPSDGRKRQRRIAPERLQGE